MRHDLIGILVVSAAVTALQLLLIHLGFLDRRDSRRGFGLYLVLAPIGLLAWFHRDLTLALLLPFNGTGAALLLRRKNTPRSDR